MIKEILEKLFKKEAEVGVKVGKSKAEKTQEYRITPELVYAFFRSDPLINACVQVTVDNVCSDGFDIEMDRESEEAEMHYEILNEFFEKNNMMEILRNITANLIVFDDAFVEVVRNNVGYPAKLYVLDTKSIKIRTDEKGEVVAYEQWINGRKVVDLEPERILHFRLNAFGDRVYGLSLLEAVMHAVAVKKFAENFTAKYFENQKPRGVWIFPSKMSNEVFNAIVEEIKEAKNDPQKDIFIRGADVRFEPLAKGEDMQFVQLLSYLRSQIVTAMLVPPILLGIPEGSNRANADIQMQAFDRRVSAIQRAIEYVINQKLIKEGFGFNDVKFRFLRINKRDTLREVQIARGLFGIATLNEIREELGLPERPDGDKIWFGQPDQQVEVGGESMDELAEQGREYARREEFDGEEVEKWMEEEGIKVEKDLGERMEEGEPAPPENPIKEKDEKKLERLLKKYLKEIKRRIRDEVRANRAMFMKAIDDPNALVEKIIEKSVVENLEEQVRDLIKLAFLKGMESVSKEGVEFEFHVDEELLNFLKNYNFDLIKGLTDDAKNKLRQVLYRGIVDGKPISVIEKEIKDVLKPVERRAEIIARTEMQRAGNYGRLEAYRKAGIKKKKWVSANDSRVCEICRKLNGLEISIDRDFEAEYNGRLYRAKAPPLHPNCRCTIVVGDE